MPQIPDWARALGRPLFHARIRSAPDDFQVREMLDVDFSGDGEHDWLHVEKTGANTPWLAEQLAEHAGIKPRDVGFSGMKDRHAVTTQWFSVRRPDRDGSDWESLDIDGVRILEQHQHRRKLKRGTHSGNAFRIALRADDIETHRDAIAERIERIRGCGLPNYFGEQRFGKDGANVELGRTVLDGRRMSRNKRSIAISALRSFEFNTELDKRVIAGTWNTLLPDDTVNLEGTGSVFAVETVTPDLERRCVDLDIHPCGLLPGFDEIGVEPSYRALRMRVADLRWEIDEGVLWLEFSLGRGGYATAVLRELVTWEAALPATRSA